MCIFAEATRSPNRLHPIKADERRVICAELLALEVTGVGGGRVLSEAVLTRGNAHAGQKIAWHGPTHFPRTAATAAAGGRGNEHAWR